MNDKTIDSTSEIPGEERHQRAWGNALLNLVDQAIEVGQGEVFAEAFYRMISPHREKLESIPGYTEFFAEMDARKARAENGFE